MDKKGPSENINCPICTTQMERGYIYSNRDIKWTDNSDDKYSIIGDETIYHPGNWSIVLKKIVAYKCKGCKCITFNYGE